MSSAALTMRKIARVLPALPTSDGAGVRLSRAIGTRSLDHLDPFLLLDHFSSDNPDDYIAGFPSHPHRGFSTLTYMLQGDFEHRDSKGNVGRLSSGSVQWMTAGRGVIHSEMPIQKDGRLSGFQLWIDLPRASKMIEPSYQDIHSEAIPELPLFDGGLVRVISGVFRGTRGPVDSIVPLLYLDTRVKPQSEAHKIQYPLPAGHACFVYVYEGSLEVDQRKVAAGNLVVFDNPSAKTTGIEEHQIEIRTSSAGYILVAAQPLEQPVVRRGPFVMCTQEDLMQAFVDYQSGAF